MADDEKQPYKHLQVSPLPVQKFIKVNELREVSNPMFFSRSNMPTEDGLLSNEIFGVTRDDRSTIFAYIHLAGESFLHPLAYKIWCKLDKNIKPCVYEMENFSLDEETGKLKEDPENGKCGLKFLKSIINKIDFAKSAKMSPKRAVKVDFIEKYRDKLFMDDLIVIPAGYRDVNTESGGRLGVGEINKMYNAIIRDAKALEESEDFGLTMNGTLRGRIQDGIVKIYNWFIFGRDPLTGQDSQASGLSRKLGLIRRAGMKKSFDWGSRLVICTQNLRKENLSDIEIDIDEIGVPIAALCANLFPFMLFWIRQWFDNQLSDVEFIGAYDQRTGKAGRTKIDDWRMVYSDDRIKKELDRFMHGMSNRFVGVEVPSTSSSRSKYKTFLQFKGYQVPDEEAARRIKENQLEMKSYPLNNRPLTWCDLIYMAAMEVTKNKMCLVTRFPMDTYWNQFPAKIKVISTIETEPMIVDGTFYPHYPKIGLQDINSNSSNKFIDVALPNNVRLDSIGGDFDGDTISVKIPYSDEANEELYNAIHKKSHYISLGGINKMTTIHEGIQALYSLTLTLDDDEKRLTPSKEIEFA